MLLDKELYDRSGIGLLESADQSKIDSKTDKNLVLTIRHNICKQYGIPKQYSFKERPTTDQQGFALIKSSQPDASNCCYALNGKINLRYEAQPVADEMYFSLKK